MHTNRISRLRRLSLVAGALSATSLIAWAAMGLPNLIIGSDANSTLNPFVQPQDPALSGGGRDQTLQFGDVLMGSQWHDVIQGGLGTDILFGSRGNDVLIGGTEHFNPSNRDRAFGGAGNDVFLWAPGDGSDFFQGGQGIDVVVFGLAGEVQNGAVVFDVENDQLAGDVFIDPANGLPQWDVTNSPGFCEVIDPSTSTNAGAELDALNLDHLVRFFIRSVADDFASGTQNTDNGLRVTLHLQGVEALVCTDRNGGVIEVLNLTTSPPTPVALSDIVNRIPRLGEILR